MKLYTLSTDFCECGTHIKTSMPQVLPHQLQCPRSSTRSGFLGTGAEAFLLAQTLAKQFNSLDSTMAPIHMAWQLREVCLLIFSQSWSSTIFHYEGTIFLVWLIFSRENKPPSFSKLNVFWSLIEALHAHINVKLYLFCFVA